MSRGGVAITLVLLVSQLANASVGLGADLTRAEYVEQSEPICKQNTIANRHILKGVREDVREDRLKLAGAKFSKAASALGQTNQRLEQLPRPSADESRLARWFTHLRDETKLLEKVAKQLRQGSRDDLGKYILELRHNANVANNVVLTFGFEYCLIQTARYI